MIISRRPFGFVLSVCAPLVASASFGAADPPLQIVTIEDLCVTNGIIAPLPNGHLAIDTPSARAVMRYQTVPTAEIRFRYLGPSAASKPLASGELRRQIGIKLRAQDTCNLLYAMWHIEPDSKIAVSVKRNPGMATHEQCGASGYINIKPSVFVALPPITAGQSHSLRAELRGAELALMADGTPVWQGSFGSQPIDFNGPIGLRTDNARFEFDYLAATRAASKPARATLARCAQTPGD